jgi:hypothetical protein
MIMQKFEAGNMGNSGGNRLVNIIDVIGRLGPPSIEVSSPSAVQASETKSGEV